VRRRLKPVDPVPVDLATFRLSSWLVWVDPDARLPADDGRSCSDECNRRQVAVRLWGAARSSWTKDHPWPGGSIERLKDEIRVRREVVAVVVAEERGSDYRT